LKPSKRSREQSVTSVLLDFILSDHGVTLG